MSSPDDALTITDLIQLAGNNCQWAKEELYQRVHRELKQMSQRLVRRQPHSDMQPTEVVQELYLRFERGQSLQGFANRRVFYAVATRAMYQILVDRARRRRRETKSLGLTLPPEDDGLTVIPKNLDYDFLALDEALQKLQVESPRQHAVIMHRFFGGLTIVETAKVLGVSRQAVERDWRLARARLFCALKD